MQNFDFSNIIFAEVSKSIKHTLQYLFTTCGEYPTEARVSELISSPGYFRYKQVRTQLDKARRELGL
jgi:hypothetical protein